MYPKNAASPPEIAVGAVVQISDGAVQTSGCSVVVRPKGGSESAGGGTLAYGASSGICYYTPTQAETNYEEFSVAVYKTGCIPAAVTVVTTDSATAGRVNVAAVAGTAQTARDLGAQLDAAVSTRLASASYTTPPTAIENADALLTRDWSSVAGAAARSVLNAMRFLRNKWWVDTSKVLHVTAEDDTTEAWTGSVTTQAGADPVVGNDPS